MEIKPNSTNLYTAISQQLSSATQNHLSSTAPPEWKIEQRLQALITKITDKQIFLDIQGVKANTANPKISNLQIGDTLKLQIEQLKPMPQFRIISFDKAVNTQLITQALRQIVAQQTSFAPLLKNISFVANRPSLRPSPLSADVNAAVRDIFKQMPSPFNLKGASQFKNQLENSGIFIENKIKNQLFSYLESSQSAKLTSQLNTNIKSDLAGDLGAQLHRLANLIRTQISPDKLASTADSARNTAQQNNRNVAQTVNTTTSGQASLQNIPQRDEAMQSFLRQIESSLSHMQQTQLQNFSESQSGRPLWLMELPIKNGQDIDLFELRITEEETQQEDGEKKKVWNITLQFDLSGLGKVKVHLKMQNELISAQFYSERVDILSLFQKNFEFLRSRLSSNGLNVGNIECGRTKLSGEIS